MPPFSHLVRLVVEGPDRTSTFDAAAGLAADLVALGAEGLDVLGPAPMHRLRGRWRRAVTLRAPRAATAVRPLAALLAARGKALADAGVRVGVDVDPQ